MGHIWRFFIWVLANVLLLLPDYEGDTMFVCPAVMKQPGQANMASYCVVPQ
jgi:hypothetical protein